MQTAAVLLQTVKMSIQGSLHLILTFVGTMLCTNQGKNQLGYYSLPKFFA